MKRGELELSPSLRRSPETWTSSVLVEPNQLTSQTSSISRSRVITEPASDISSSSSSNSLRVRSSSSPSSVALRRARSSRSEPTSIGAPWSDAPSPVRRSTARMRATTSRALKGLTM